MSSEKERITISIPEDEGDLLEEVDQLVDEGLYKDRTEVFQQAIDVMTGYATELNEAKLYDAAHSAYVEAHQKEMYEIKENARSHILERYGRTHMLDRLDELMEE